MAITINGTGSITGLTAGGLPDGSITTDDIAANAVTAAKLAAGAGGKILQVVTTDYTGEFSTSAANTFEQITGLNSSITLASSSSKVLIMLTIGQASTANGASGSFAVTRGGTRILLGAAAGTRGQTSIKFYNDSSSHSSGFSFIGVDSPGASGSYTYGAQASAQGGTTLYVNRTQINSDLTDSYEHRAASHLTLMEIAS